MFQFGVIALGVISHPHESIAPPNFLDIVMAKSYICTPEDPNTSNVPFARSIIP
jgi:hypothetical protein